MDTTLLSVVLIVIAVVLLNISYQLSGIIRSLFESRDGDLHSKGMSYAESEIERWKAEDREHYIEMGPTGLPYDLETKQHDRRFGHLRHFFYKRHLSTVHPVFSESQIAYRGLLITEFEENSNYFWDAFLDNAHKTVKKHADSGKNKKTFKFDKLLRHDHRNAFEAKTRIKNSTIILHKMIEANISVINNKLSIKQAMKKFEDETEGIDTYATVMLDSDLAEKRRDAEEEFEKHCIENWERMKKNYES